MHKGCFEFNRLGRRDFLRVGGASIFGLTAADLFRAQAQATETGAPKAKAKQMILIWLPGGPPHIDMFDPKPNSPEEIRGEFKNIKTNVTGFEVTELLPRLAKIADKYTLIRSCTTGSPIARHAPATQHWMRSNPRPAISTPKYPTYGCVVSKLFPSLPDLPSFVTLDRANGVVFESYLGSAHGPLSLGGSKDVTEMLSLGQLSLDEFQRDVDLAGALNQKLRQLDQLDPIIEGRDQFQQKAFDLLRSPKLREAIDLKREDPKHIERYVTVPKGSRGAKPNCEKVIMARRLIEAGVPFVQLNMFGWDNHSDNANRCRGSVPAVDSAVASLLEDLDDRGLLDTTIVALLGEMGRTPWVQGTSGRDHYPVQFVFVAGGGFKRGCVVGATDKHGAEVTDDHYLVESFAATIYTLLGIDPFQELRTTAGRPIRIVLKDVPLIKEALA